MIIVHCSRAIAALDVLAAIVEPVTGREVGIYGVETATVVKHHVLNNL